MLRKAFLAARPGLAAAFAFGALAGTAPAAATTGSGSSQMWSFDFYDMASGTSVAHGELAHAGTARGQLGFGDLTHFTITVHGVGYDLADMAALSDQAWLGWDSEAGGFVRHDSICGLAGCIGALISARSPDGSRGFRIDDAAMMVHEYSTGRSGSYDLVGLGQAMPLPEPASWALLVAGFGLTGAALRRARPAGMPTAGGRRAA